MTANFVVGVDLEVDDFLVQPAEELARTIVFECVSDTLHVKVARRRVSHGYGTRQME